MRYLLALEEIVADLFSFIRAVVTVKHSVTDIVAVNTLSVRAPPSTSAKHLLNYVTYFKIIFEKTKLTVLIFLILLINII